MTILPSSQTGAHGGRQQNWASSPVRAVGNLQFNTGQGGTARGGGPGVRPRTDGLSANMMFSAHPAFPQTSLRRVIRDLARQDISRTGMLLYGLETPSGPDQHLLQETLRLLDQGSEIQAFVMLDHLRASLAGTIRAQSLPELRELQAWMAQAVNAQDRLGASKALCILDTVVNRSRGGYGPLPKEMAEDVRMLASSSLDLFRDAEQNPEGPLNAASLRGLDDFTFACLRRASHLHSLGLELDLEAADDAAHARVGVLSWQAVEHVMSVLRTLAGDAVDMPTLIRQMRDLSGLEWQRVQRLTVLGQFAGGAPGPEQRRAMVKRTCELAVEELSRTPSQVLTLHNAIVHMDQLAELEGIFGRIASRLETLLVQQGYTRRRVETMQQIVTTRDLLAGIAGEMAQQLSDLLSGQGSSDVDIDLYVELVSRMALNPAAGIQSSSFYSALREHYGVAYDPLADDVALLMIEPARGQGGS